MANVTVRRNQGGGGGMIAEGNDPFRMVRESMRRMQDLFRDPSFEIDPIGFMEMGRLQAYAPDFEVRERQDGLVFTADVPGVKEEDLEITVVGNRLRISGKREFEQESRADTWYAAERSYGNFTRTFILPEGCDTDKVYANLANGVLTIELGKRSESQPRRVQLGAGQQQRALEGKHRQGARPQAGAYNQPAGQPSGAEGYCEPAAAGQPVHGEQGYGDQPERAPQAELPGQAGKVPEKV